MTNISGPNPSIQGSQPEPIRNNSFLEKRKNLGEFFEAQAAAKKAAAVLQQVKAEQTGTVPEEVSTEASTAQVKKEDIEKLAKNPEAVKLKAQTEKTQSFFMRLISFVLKLLNYLNPMAYINKNKDKEYLKGTPEQLSQAAQKLHDYFLAYPEVFKAEGIFRISPAEEDKKKLFNQLLRSPQQDLPESLSPDLLAGAFKKIYANLNLFGGHVELFKNIGAQLLVQPKPAKEEVVRLLNLLKEALPVERQKDLKNYIEVLANANEENSTNLMTAENLAIAAGPNLCDVLDLSIIKPRQEIAAQLITHYQEVFSK